MRQLELRIAFKIVEPMFKDLETVKNLSNKNSDFEAVVTDALLKNNMNITTLIAEHERSPNTSLLSNLIPVKLARSLIADLKTSFGEDNFRKLSEQCPDAIIDECLFLVYNSNSSFRDHQDAVAFCADHNIPFKRVYKKYEKPKDEYFKLLELMEAAV